MFERDPQKSKHDTPKRHIATAIVTRLKSDAVDLSTAKITILPNVGEILRFPFYAKDKVSANVVAFEAYLGGVMDQFSQVQSGEELLEMGKKVIQQLKPDYYEVVKDMQLVDEQAWISGKITQTVRQPIGRLPSGTVVMGIGDPVILHDPIAGQGANNATKMTHLVKQRIIEHGSQRFDQSWMQRVFDEWHYAQYTHALTDCMLTPPEHLLDIMAAMAEKPKVARDYLNGVNHPPSLFPWFFNPESAKEYLAQKSACVAPSSQPNQFCLVT